MKSGKVIKTFTSKKGKEVVLRYPKSDDVDQLLSFANALIAEDTFIELSGKLLTRDEETAYLKVLLKDIEKGNKFHITVTVDNKIVGNAEVRKQTRRKSHVGEVGISLLKEFRGEGIGKELLLTLIEEGKRMKLRLLTLNCFECNTGALALYEKLGFKKAGIIPAAILFKGNYCGEVKMFLPLV